MLADLKNRFGVAILEGYKAENGVYSAGVRFRNGPFFDVFDWPRNKPPFTPLLAFEGEIAKAQTVATKFGWDAQLQLRNDIPHQHRPPWSILSFRSGQGPVSSVFVIEYEDAPEAWDVDVYRGPLYERRNEPNGSFELNKVVINAAEITKAALQLEALIGRPLALLELCQAGDFPEGVKAIHLRSPNGTTAEWQPSAFDQNTSNRELR